VDEARQRVPGVQYFTNGALESGEYLYICTVIRDPPLLDLC
jgi:hypothetical protein